MSYAWVGRCSSSLQLSDLDYIKMSKLQANTSHQKALRHLLCCTGLFDGEDATYVQQALRKLMPIVSGNSAQAMDVDLTSKY